VFQFPGFASYTYVFSARYLPFGKWVSPFGHLRIILIRTETNHWGLIVMGHTTRAQITHHFQTSPLRNGSNLQAYIDVYSFDLGVRINGIGTQFAANT